MGDTESTQHPGVIYGDEQIMAQKEHGTTRNAPEGTLRWDCNHALADRICCYNRHGAEPSGSFQKTKFLTEVNPDGETVYYDTVSKKPLFIAPKGRTHEEFLAESKAHGWPSFRFEEVVWDNVRVLPDGEAVSVDGTHLGHNIPDKKGPRFCINLVSVAGMPPSEK